MIDLNLSIGIGIGFAIGLIVWFISSLRKKKEKKERVSLSGMKGYLKEAHNQMVEANNNLISAVDNIIKVYEVFNEIEGK